jgi:hypothetical protein
MRACRIFPINGIHFNKTAWMNGGLYADLHRPLSAQKNDKGRVMQSSQSLRQALIILRQEAKVWHPAGTSFHVGALNGRC